MIGVCLSPLANFWQRIGLFCLIEVPENECRWETIRHRYCEMS